MNKTSYWDLYRKRCLILYEQKLPKTFKKQNFIQLMLTGDLARHSSDSSLSEFSSNPIFELSSKNIKRWI